MERDQGWFPADDLDAATRVIESVLGHVGGSEERWCNLSLEVEAEHAPPPDSVLFALFSARGPWSPFVTLMSSRLGKRPRPAQLGIQHRTGTRCAQRLEEAGLAVPEAWLILSDHPKRGLLLGLPDAAQADSVAAWLLPVMESLNRTPTTGAILYENFVA